MGGFPFVLMRNKRRVSFGPVAAGMGVAVCMVNDVS